MSRIHPSAVIDPGAELDSSVEVGPFTVIGPHVRVGAGTRIGAHCVIEGRTTIGEHAVRSMTSGKRVCDQPAGRTALDGDCDDRPLLARQEPGSTTPPGPVRTKNRQWTSRHSC